MPPNYFTCIYIYIFFFFLTFSTKEKKSNIKKYFYNIEATSRGLMYN